MIAFSRPTRTGLPNLMTGKLPDVLAAEHSVASRRNFDINVTAVIVDMVLEYGSRKCKPYLGMIRIVRNSDLYGDMHTTASV